MSAKSLRLLACAGVLAFLPIALTVHFLLLRPDSASAAIFLVNSTGDQSDLVPGDSVCLAIVVPPTCTLRAAIEESNALAGTDIINFAILGVGPHTIAPGSALPTISSPVTIDGYSQPGALANTNPVTSGSNAVIAIELNGASAGVGVDGLRIGASGTTVAGVAVNRFGGSGIEVVGGTGSVVKGNFIGTDVNGTTDLGNSAWGVLVLGSSNSTIGGTAAGARNVISGNDTIGIEICCTGATGISIEGNLIGTDRTGTADLGNSQWGILINSSPGNTLGGTAAGARNVISGNNTIGIEVVNPQATGNLVQGNYIGTDVNGGVDVGNGTWGILVNNAPNNTIGGTSAGARNVISGNDRFGIEIVAGLATGNLLQGNYIGADVTGTLAVGNTSGGAFVNAAPSNTIGGAAAGAGNIISGNDARGLTINSSGNVVEGNHIGVDATGTLDLGNTTDGVAVFAANNTIGGTAAGARNVISGNSASGVLIEAASASGNLVQGNLIGTDVTGTVDLGNTAWGVLMNGSPGNTIGGTAVAARNVISGNDSLGIGICCSGAIGNLVQGNYIGTDVSGTLDLGNTSAACPSTVGFEYRWRHCLGARNVISGNDGRGVDYAVVGATGNLVQGNYIGTDATGRLNSATRPWVHISGGCTSGR